MFIDTVKILVSGGDGGNGCNSIYRDKMNMRGRPDGGDGGDGGNVLLKASRSVFTLLDFKYRHEFTAGRGRHGSSNNKRGRDGEDVVILVPQGTQVIEESTKCILEDLNSDNQEIIVAKGGKGGFGNKYRKKEALPGEPGETRSIILDLKLIADVGIIGFPNAGKSTLISKISSARPQIAPYPFTTKDPILGVVKRQDFDFSIVDIPGLIEGAHQGRGLGDKFLRHVERTKILVHLVDMAGVDARDPLDDYEIINRELKFYSPEVANKTQILAANKMDLEPAKDNLKRFKSKFRKKIIEISAKDSVNIGILIDEITKKLQKISH